MNKNIFAGLAVSAVMAMAASSPVMANNAAYVTDNGGCGMFDENFALTVIADADHSVINHGANGVIKCYATTSNTTGKAIRFSGFLCNVNGTLTNRSWEVIDSEGNATLTCQFKR